MKDVKNTWLFNKPVAHRGLWDEQAPENTKSAFLKAIENDYAIEIDVQMTLDKEIVVLHDSNMSRIFGIDKDIRDLNYSDVKELTPFGKNDKIMTLREFLDFVDGRTPILLEIKPAKQKGIEERVVEILKDYKGDIAIQSFSPIVIKNVAKITDKYMLGVICSKEEWPDVAWIIRKFLHSLLFLPMVKIDFLSIRATDIATYGKKIFKYPIISWTIRNEEDLRCAEKYADNIIFEKTTPSLSHFGEKKW